MKKFFLAMLVCAFVVSFAGMSMAADEKKPAPAAPAAAAPAAPAPAVPAAPAAPAVKADAAKPVEVTIIGEVVKDAHGAITIKAVDGEYKVAGKDVAAMAGKKVKATGAVAEKDKVKTLHVTKVEEVK